MQWIIDHAPLWALPYIYRLTEREWMIVVNVVFAVGLLALSAFSAYCFLRAAGWRRFKGRWYNAEQFAALIQELYSGVREGRVPDYETMRLLDRHIYGRNGSLIRDMTRRDAI